MPPASFVPGCSSGDVCTDSTAIRRGREAARCREIVTDSPFCSAEIAFSVVEGLFGEPPQCGVELARGLDERKMAHP